MFPATITLHNAAQLNAVMRALGETPVGNFDVQAAIDKAESTVKTTKAAETAKADKPAAQTKGDNTEKKPDAKTAPTEPTASADKADAQEAKELTYLADIKPRVLNLVKGGKRTQAVELLASFGVDHGEKLKEDQYADFVVKADKLLGA